MIKHNCEPQNIIGCINFGARRPLHTATLNKKLHLATTVKVASILPSRFYAKSTMPCHCLIALCRVGSQFISYCTIPAHCKHCAGMLQSC